MSGTPEGGKKTARTNLEKYGKDFYKRIGAKGGRNGCGPDYKGGFAADVERARIAGAKGGRISRRGPAKKKTSLKERREAEAKREEKVGVWKKLKNFMS